MELRVFSWRSGPLRPSLSLTPIPSTPSGSAAHAGYQGARSGLRSSMPVPAAVGKAEIDAALQSKYGARRYRKIDYLADGDPMRVIVTAAAATLTLAACTKPTGLHRRARKRWLRPIRQSAQATAIR